MTDSTLETLRTHPLFAFFAAEGLPEDVIVEAVRSSGTLDYFLASLDIKNPMGLPGKPHPVSRSPKARADFLEIRALVMEENA